MLSHLVGDLAHEFIETGLAQTPLLLHLGDDIRFCKSQVCIGCTRFADRIAACGTIGVKVVEVCEGCAYCGFPACRGGLLSSVE